MLDFVLGIVPMLLIISLIITIHEMGHFWTGKIFRTRIERFSLGIGNIIWRRTDRHGVEWCISALPLGGYVKFAGDENIASTAPDLESLKAARESITREYGAGAEKSFFHFKPLWQRAFIIAAGPAMNFVLAITIFATKLLIFGDFVSAPVIAEVEPGSPAAHAGLLPGDRITAIDGRSIQSFLEVKQLISLRSDSSAVLNLDRNGTRLSRNVHLTHADERSGFDNQTQRGGHLGIRGVETQTHINYGPIEALIEGNRLTWSILDSNLTYIGRIFTGKDQPDQLHGILGMTSVAGQAAKATAQIKASLEEKTLSLVVYYFMMAGFISVGVGFVNLLPLPVLDGGHLMFYAVEAVTQKPVSPQIAEFSFKIGLVAIIGLMLFAAYNDVTHFGLLNLFSRGHS